MRLLSMLALLSATLTGCGGGGAADVTNSSGGTPTSLALSPPTSALSVGGSVQLVVSGKDASGNLVADLPAPTFSVADKTVATVDASGLVTAVALGATEVTATVDGAGVASATVTVTPPGSAGGTTVTTPNERFSPATVSIAPGGTVTWEISGATHNVTFAAAAPTGGNVPDTPAGGSASRTFDSAGSYAYQCTRHSGMSGVVVVQGGGGATPPPAQPPPAAGTTITVNANAFSPEDVTIAPGESVTWQFAASQGITFEDESPPEGDIPLSEPGTSITRTFPSPGDYKYQSIQDEGMDGRIRVR